MGDGIASNVYFEISSVAYVVVYVDMHLVALQGGLSFT